MTADRTALSRTELADLLTGAACSVSALLSAEYPTPAARSYLHPVLGVLSAGPAVVGELNDRLEDVLAEARPDTPAGLFALASYAAALGWFTESLAELTDTVGHICTQVGIPAGPPDPDLPSLLPREDSTARAGFDVSVLELAAVRAAAETADLTPSQYVRLLSLSLLAAARITDACMEIAGGLAEDAAHVLGDANGHLRIGEGSDSLPTLVRPADPDGDGQVNPHDPSVRPGAHLVAAELGVDEPWELSDRHPLRSPLDIVGRLVATAAHETDDLHADLTRAAKAAIETLEPISQGKAPQMRGAYGLLGTAGPQLELLAARRDTAYQQLARAVAGYRRLHPEVIDAAAEERGLAPERTAEEAPGRNDDWAIADGRQLQALRAVERGGLRLKQSALSEQDRYLSDGTGILVPIWAQTVERMLADGLLGLDTTTTPVQGQLLSLTALGQAALQVAEGVAALSRSAPNSLNSRPAVPPAVGPAGQTKPTRSR